MNATKAISASILGALAAVMLALLLSSCTPAPTWGVILIVPERAEIAGDPVPAYQLTHVGVEYPDRGQCEAVWGDRCRPSATPKRRDQ